MAGYAPTTNPPRLIAQGIGGTGVAIWTHDSTDAAATVDGAGFITDGGKRGMKVGDLVMHQDSDSAALLTSSMTVVTVSSTYPGAVDLSNAITLGGAAAGD